MKNIEVVTREPYNVTVGSNILPIVGEVCSSYERAVVINQAGIPGEYVAAVHKALAEHATEVFAYELVDGESAKSMSVLEDLCTAMATAGLSRRDVVVAIGGGVTGDIGGFAAAIYHRGIAVVQVPTTLLSQVDASIGGKTAVNLRAGKNLVGAFHQPVAVIADIDTLTTLPDREFLSGLGEVAKYALSGDTKLLSILHEATGELLAKQANVLEEVVALCVERKAGVVQADERDTNGERVILNYGHTLAHALEIATNYELRHGEAVAIGLVYAAELAYQLGRISPEKVAEHRDLLTKLGLPTAAPANLNQAEVLALMGRDKKADGNMTFVLWNASQLEVVANPDMQAVQEALRAVGIGDKQ